MDLDPELLPAFALTLDEFALWLHLLVNLVLALVAIVKGRVVLGVVGVFVPVVAAVGAVRLARPNSPWARRRYRVEGRRAARSRQRFPPGRRHWWDDLVTLFAVAPSPSATAGR